MHEVEDVPWVCGMRGIQRRREKVGEDDAVDGSRGVYRGEEGVQAREHGKERGGLRV